MNDDIPLWILFGLPALMAVVFPFIVWRVLKSADENNEENRKAITDRCFMLNDMLLEYMIENESLKKQLGELKKGMK